MGLRETLAKAAATAFNVAGNVPVSIVVTHYTGAPVRDPVTGAYTRPSVMYTDPQAVRTTFTAEESRANVLSGDLKLIGQVSRVQEADVDDIVTLGARTYVVIAVTKDPADVTYTLHVREKTR
jgi:hypothetical protein